MKIVRQKCFETNSSSCHSISLTHSGNDSNGCSKIWDRIIESITDRLDELDVLEIENDKSGWKHVSYEITLPITLTGGEYGWEFGRYYNLIDKLNYVLTSFYYGWQSLDDFLESEDWKRFKSIFGSIDYFSFNGIKRFDIPEYSTLKIKFDFEIDKEEIKDAYIDHESIGILSDLTDEQLRDLVFDPRNAIITDADG